MLDRSVVTNSQTKTALLPHVHMTWNAHAFFFCFKLTITIVFYRPMNLQSTIYIRSKYKIIIKKNFTEDWFQ